MPMIHPSPTRATVKELYATALRCGFPECTEPLYRVVGGSAARTLNSRICHICARSEGGPRWDPAMSALANQHKDNLVLLCLPHAARIDDPAQLQHFPVAELRRWKTSQVSTYDRSVNYELSDDEAQDVIDQLNTTIHLRADTIIVGGLGGSAMGAAGGGGGAIGAGALGGDGGSVGRIDLDGKPGSAPGAGGGGGGVLAPGAIASKSSQVEAGKGFVGAGDGGDGGDSVVRYQGVELRAPGGKGGLAGTGIRKETDQLRVSALLFANYIERRGLTTIVSAGWESYSILNIPEIVCIPTYMLLEADGIDPGEFTISIDVFDPSGRQRSRVSFPLTVEKRGDVLRIPHQLGLSISVDCWGLWQIAVSTPPTRELARTTLLFRRLGEA